MPETKLIIGGEEFTVVELEGQQYVNGEPVAVVANWDQRSITYTTGVAHGDLARGLSMAFERAWRRRAVPVIAPKAWLPERPVTR